MEPKEHPDRDCGDPDCEACAEHSRLDAQDRAEDMALEREAQSHE